MMDALFMTLQRIKWGVVGFVLLVVLFLIAGDLALTTNRHLHSMREQAGQNQTQITSLQTQINQLKAENAQVISAERASLPNALDVPSVLIETETVANKAHVRLDSFSFNPTASDANSTVLNEPNVKPYGVTVNVTGTRAQVLAFVADLESYPKFTTVQTVGLNTTGQTLLSPNQVVSMGIDFDVYTDP